MWLTSNINNFSLSRTSIQPAVETQNCLIFIFNFHLSYNNSLDVHDNKIYVPSLKPFVFILPALLAFRQSTDTDPNRLINSRKLRKVMLLQSLLDLTMCDVFFKEKVNIKIEKIKVKFNLPALSKPFPSEETNIAEFILAR
jgi:hypothetical protein